MSEIFGAAGQVASAAISANAIKSATQKQIDALERQRQFVFDQLSPAKLQEQATGADVQRAQQRLALQAQLDPGLSAVRFASQNKLLDQLGGLGGGDVANVAGTAASEAVKGIPGMDQLKQNLIDRALHELSLGATLPPDVQNEFVKAGLEKSGMVTGAASPKGFGGHIIRQLLGTAGIQLQQQRQQNAMALSQSAQQLESQRQQILGTLFPNLSTVQLNTAKTTGGLFDLANQSLPQAGLGGTDIANLWLARVGATNQLAQQSANAAAAGGMGQAQAWQSGLGAAVPYAANALPSTASLWGGYGGGGGGGGYGGQGFSDSMLSSAAGLL